MISPEDIKHYHIFLASPEDMAVERRSVRRFFERYKSNDGASLGHQFRCYRLGKLRRCRRRPSAGTDHQANTRTIP